MIKRFLQRWLGIQELSDMIALSKPKDIEAGDPSDMWPEQPAIIKGYDRHQPPTA